MNFSSSKRLRQLNVNTTENTVTSKCKSLESPSSSNDDGTTKLKLCLPRQVSCDTINPISPSIIEPPSWAVAAQGDARLEPVGESINLQSSIDLSTQAVFNVGRSQNSDVQLLHCTSSRRHALVFHHPNGSCYVVDCGSAHGTYVNGVRVKTLMRSENNDPESSGVILPHRLKRGSLIRFGGPGAPTFILKSFAVSLKTLVGDLEALKEAENLHPSPPLECSSESDEDSIDALVALNTRLNAISAITSALPPFNGEEESVSAPLGAQMQSSNVSYLKKRSIISFDEDSDSEIEVKGHKKMKMSTDLLSEFTDSCDVAIVSPSRQKPTFSFNVDDIDRPVVSPSPIPEESQAALRDPGNLETNKSILSVPLSLTSPSKKRSRVTFSDVPPAVFYPPSITPDSSSDSES